MAKHQVERMAYRISEAAEVLALSRSWIVKTHTLSVSDG